MLPYKIVEPLLSWGTLFIGPAVVMSGNLTCGFLIYLLGEGLSSNGYFRRMVLRMRDARIRIVREFPPIQIEPADPEILPYPPMDMSFLEDLHRLQPTVYLAGPHGLFGIGLKRLMGSTLLPPGSVAMFDSTLYHMSLGATWSARTLGHTSAPLTHKSISRLMSGKQRPNLCVLPGGFVEAAGATDTTEYISLDKIAYYQKMCKRYGYRLQYLMIYGGSTFYRHHDLLRGARLSLAAMGIPAVAATPTNVVGGEVDTIAVRPFHIDLDASLSHISDQITATYISDATTLEQADGLTTKSLEIRSNL